MDDDQRYFTLEQANAIILAIRPLMGEILTLRWQILDQQPDAWPALSRDAGNGGNKAASQVAHLFRRLDLLVREIRATGVVVKDINTGLVDLLAKREDRDVYFCWKYGESRIKYWHEIEAGFAGRQLLD